MRKNTDYSVDENDKSGLINEFISSFDYFTKEDKEKILSA